MADYNENDIGRMRRDALRRMQEMQRRAMGGDPKPSPPPPRQEQSGDISSLIGSLLGQGGLSGLGVDSEKAMIALLIYILYKQGADVKLLLALGYLLL